MVISRSQLPMTTKRKPTKRQKKKKKKKVKKKGLSLIYGNKVGLVRL